jgi:membrane protein DedA with SNARE-associated domain
MAFFDLTHFAQGLAADYVYLGPLLLLCLCGFGLPIPEEVTLIGAGLLLYQNEAHPTWMGVACIVGVVAGDAVPYTIGRLWGTSALRYRPVRRLIHPRRFRRLERRFHGHRNWAVFSTRFFPGLRWPGYFVAGTLRVGVARWLLLDLAGALIQVPAILWLGLQFGSNVDRLRGRVEDLHLWLAFLLLAVVATFWVRARIRAGSRRPPGAADGGAPGAELPRPLGGSGSGGPGSGAGGLPPLRPAPRPDPPAEPRR